MVCAKKSLKEEKEKEEKELIGLGCLILAKDQKVELLFIFG